MKTTTLTFYCDVPKCAERITVGTYDGEVGAHLDIAAAGWKVQRARTWKHVCPAHEIDDLRT